MASDETALAPQTTQSNTPAVASKEPPAKLADEMGSVEKRAFAAVPPALSATTSALATRPATSTAPASAEEQVAIPQELKREAAEVFATGKTYFIWPDSKSIKCPGKSYDIFRALILGFTFVAKDEKGEKFIPSPKTSVCRPV